MMKKRFHKQLLNKHHNEHSTYQSISTIDLTDMSARRALFSYNNQLNKKKKRICYEKSDSFHDKLHPNEQYVLYSPEQFSQVEYHKDCEAISVVDEFLIENTINKVEKDTDMPTDLRSSFWVWRSQVEKGSQVTKMDYDDDNDGNDDGALSETDTLTTQFVFHNSRTLSRRGSSNTKIQGTFQGMTTTAEGSGSLGTSMPSFFCKVKATVKNFLGQPSNSSKVHHSQVQGDRIQSVHQKRPVAGCRESFRRCRPPTRYCDGETARTDTSEIIQGKDAVKSRFRVLENVKDSKKRKRSEHDTRNIVLCECFIGRSHDDIFSNVSRTSQEGDVLPRKSTLEMIPHFLDVSSQYKEDFELHSLSVSSLSRNSLGGDALVDESRSGSDSENYFLNASVQCYEDDFISDVCSSSSKSSLNYRIFAETSSSKFKDNNLYYDVSTQVEENYLASSSQLSVCRSSQNMVLRAISSPYNKELYNASTKRENFESLGSRISGNINKTVRESSANTYNKFCNTRLKCNYKETREAKHSCRDMFVQTDEIFCKETMRENSKNEIYTLKREQIKPSNQNYIRSRLYNFWTRNKVNNSPFSLISSNLRKCIQRANKIKSYFRGALETFQKSLHERIIVTETNNSNASDLEKGNNVKQGSFGLVRTETAMLQKPFFNGNSDTISKALKTKSMDRSSTLEIDKNTKENMGVRDSVQRIERKTRENSTSKHKGNNSHKDGSIVFRDTTKKQSDSIDIIISSELVNKTITRGKDVIIIEVDNRDDNGRINKDRSIQRNKYNLNTETCNTINTKVQTSFMEIVDSAERKVQGINIVEEDKECVQSKKYSVLNSCQQKSSQTYPSSNSITSKELITGNNPRSEECFYNFRGRVTNQETMKLSETIDIRSVFPTTYPFSGNELHQTGKPVRDAKKADELKTHNQDTVNHISNFILSTVFGDSDNDRSTNKKASCKSNSYGSSCGQLSDLSILRRIFNNTYICVPNSQSRVNESKKFDKNMNTQINIDQLSSTQNTLQKAVIHKDQFTTTTNAEYNLSENILTSYDTTKSAVPRDINCNKGDMIDDVQIAPGNSQRYFSGSPCWKEVTVKHPESISEESRISTANSASSLVAINFIKNYKNRSFEYYRPFPLKRAKALINIPCRIKDSVTVIYENSKSSAYQTASSSNDLVFDKDNC